MSILLIDVDGTLVGRQNAVPDSARKAIAKARENGHQIYLVTGRSKAELYDDVLDVGIDGILGGNGSYIEDHGKVLFHQTVDLEDVKKIVDWLYENKLPFYLESNSGLYPSPHYRKALEEIINPYIAPAGLRRFLDEMVDTSSYSKEDYYRDDLAKISYLLDDDSTFEKANQLFPELKQNRWSINSNAKHGDVGVPKIDKKEAIKKLLAHLNETPDHLIAFGDEPVDIPMFEIAGTSVAMGSGAQELKEIADYITDAPDDDGLYNAFVKLNLIDPD